MKLRGFVCSLLVGAVTLSGCSSAYTPRPSPRVAIVVKGGSPRFVRDGKVYEGGLFGGEIEEVVRGNPEAEEHARSYQTGMITGFVATLAGAVGFGAGAGIALANGARPEEERDTSMQTTGLALAAGGLAAYVVGLVLISNAQPHMWDAINVYNDGVFDPGRPPPYGPYAPTAAPPVPHGPVAPPTPPQPPALVPPAQ